MLGVVGFFLPEIGIVTSFLELIDAKEWSMPALVAQRSMLGEISLHNNRDGIAA